MKTNFDYILIDSAPIIPVSDGIVLGKLADVIIMIVKAGSTTHNISQTAIKRFSSAKLKPTGVVLSQLDYKSSNYYYGKYDYYTKEYYGWLFVVVRESIENLCAQFCKNLCASRFEFRTVFCLIVIFLRTVCIA